MSQHPTTRDPSTRPLLLLLPLLPLLLLLAAAGCRSTPETPSLTDDAELDAFARQVEADLEAHRWRDLIALAHPAHYRAQVFDHGMGEAQYIAELFGLHHVGNNIKRGERVQWTDLERIAEVDLERITTTTGSPRLVGTVTLRDGSTLTLRAQAAREGGRHVLTGGVG